ncbi:MAG: hypothetical protein ACLFMM_08420 [Methanohalobium sp.]|uniref:hypothetical protein n=1 Tax=Methanohalobium sp. TaxID=2837493 RepID=UPI00397803AE
MITVVCFTIGLVGSAGATADAEEIQMHLSDGIEASQEEDGEVHWKLPGPRELDPRIFGTPDAPLGFEDDIGVPIADKTT